MSITKWNQVACNECGQADYYTGPYANIMQQARENGWIVRSKEKTFCTEQCESDWQQKRKGRKK